MNATAEGASLLRAVLAEPEDDGIRVVYADWLEDHGESDRSAFVRVQIELAQREADGRDRSECLWGGSCCCRSHVLRRRERELMAPGRKWWSDYGPGDRVTVLEWRRGFVERVAVTCEDFMVHGPRLVRLQPLREVRLTDREPLDLSTGNPRDIWAGWHTWGSEALPGPIESDLPTKLFSRLDGERVHTNSYNVYYPSREEAERALSAACLAWARSTEPNP